MLRVVKLLVAVAGVVVVGLLLVGKWMVWQANAGVDRANAAIDASNVTLTTANEGWERFWTADNLNAFPGNREALRKTADGLGKSLDEVAAGYRQAASEFAAASKNVHKEHQKEYFRLKSEYIARRAEVQALRAEHIRALVDNATPDLATFSKRNEPFQAKLAALVKESDESDKKASELMAAHKSDFKN